MKSTSLKIMALAFSTLAFVSCATQPAQNTSSNDDHRGPMRNSLTSVLH